MVGSCAAYNCTKRGGNLHRFPLTKPALLQRWIKNIRRVGFKPGKHSRICSEHFRSEDYKQGLKRRQLKPEAVPTIFDFPSHLKTVNKKRASPKKRSAPTKQSSRVSLVEKQRRVSLDHSYSIPKDPTDIITSLRERNNSLHRRIRTLQQNCRRKKSRLQKLDDILKGMLDKRYIEHEVYRILKESFSDLTSTIFKHEFENRKRNPHARQYSDPKVVNFAITLHYYSPKAYEYVRNVLCLPHPSTLREWASSINCNPGHLDNVYKHLSNRVLQHPLTSDCSLIIDEMSLKRETEWDSSCRQFSGFVDYGGGPVEGEIAQNALVLMLVGTRIHWKVPVGYAFTKHVNAENLRTLVKKCIIKASNIGLSVLSVVADVSSVNLRAAVLLWCSFDVKTMRTWFPHPYRTSDKIYWICDASHMLKLMRNLLAEYEILARTTGESTEKIRWFYIQELHKLQMKDSLILANKLSGRHVHYRNLIMKVNIAAQTMSSSVATALDFLRDDMKLPQFKGSEATCHFIRIIDRLFDTLNSKNPFAKGFKSPLRKENKMHWDPFLRYAKDYLLTLKRNDGCFIIDTRRKVPVVGFSITISSILELSNHLLSYPHYAYVLTYKFSQDHIEMLFSKIRRRGGWNNNPSSSQFRYALRTLLMTNSVKASLNANAVAQDDTADIHLQFGRNSNGDSRQALTAFESEESEEDSDMILSKMDSVFDLNGADWRRDVLYYIAGFVSRKLRKMITCPSCNLALFRQETEEPLSDVDSFLKRKDNGGLLTPSKGVFEVVLAAEKAFRSYVPASVAAEVLPSIKYLDLKIEHSVLKYINPCETFISLGEHFEDHEIGITELLFVL